MVETPADLRTPRLTLRWLSLAMLQAGVAGEAARFARLLGAAIPPDWLDERAFWRLRRDDYRRDPAYLSWGPRAALLGRQAIGVFGYHTPPGPRYLDEIAPGGVELGYRLSPPWRRQGYAGEAVQALIDHARRQGVPRIVLSISPNNASSLALAARLGFRRVALHHDPLDGLEYVFLRAA